jgi:D-3-phosphoglycerate dehydrogenase / 2-oxoglutarate reductase
MARDAQVKKKILITDRFAFESQLFLEREGPFELIRTENPLTLPLDQLVSCHALLIRSKTQITSELFEKARNLQVIVTMTSGFDHIDLPAAQKWGVTVMHTPWAHRESAAQLTWSLVMACASNVVSGQNQIQNKTWSRDKLKGFELNQRTYGILGLGRIGSRVAEMAQAFGMKVIAFDPYQETEVFQNLGVERMGLEEVFHHADVISCHVPKTPETKDFLHRHIFESMPKPLVLVNTCRGSIIKEEVLAEALTKKWLLAAAQDVFVTEPLPLDSPLRLAPNLILTPHIGSQTEEALAKASQMAAEKISRFFISGMTSDTLPPKAAWYLES